MALLVKRPAWTVPVGAAVGAVTGVYLMAAPSLLDYTRSAPEVSHRIVGPILVVLWLVAGWSVTRSVRWWTVPPAAWLLIEPLVLEESRGAAAGAVVVGIMNLFVAAAMHDGDVARRYAGGWRGLFSAP